MEPDDKILAKIAVKNILFQMYKRMVEIEHIHIMQREFSAYENPEELIELKNMDYKEYEEELAFHKDIADTGKTGGYQILFWEKLPYRVPIAMQSAIAMRKDMEGVEINNVFDFDESVRMQNMHLCVFPLEKESIVLAFYHKRDKLYRRLRHQFNSSSKEAILGFLNYVIFEYTENYYISKTIQDEITTNESLRKLSQEGNELPDGGMLNFENMFGKGYVPVKIEDIPNFLSEEWKVPIE